MYTGIPFMHAHKKRARALVFVTGFHTPRTRALALIFVTGFRLQGAAHIKTLSYEDFVPLLDAEEVVIADLGYSWCEEQNRSLAPNPENGAGHKPEILRAEQVISPIP